MGVLAPRLPTLDGSTRTPINTRGNFPAHVSAELSLNISPNLSEVISEVSDPYDNFSQYQIICHSAGGKGGSSNLLFDWNAHILLLRASCQVSES